MPTRLAPLGLAALLGILASSSQAAAQQAHTVRISDHPVFLDLRVDNAPLRVKVFNGEMARITFQGVTVGVTPKLTPEGGFAPPPRWLAWRAGGPAGARQRPADARRPCSQCCVTCDGVKACGCEVSQPCGQVGKAEGACSP